MQELSASQIAMLSDQLLNPGHVGTVLTPTAIAECGASVDQIRQAWSMLCDRLPALRGHVVPTARGFALEHGTGEVVADVRGADTVRSAAVRRELSELGVIPFDLESRNLIRLNARTDGRFMVVSIVVHHILMDVTSAFWVHSDFSACLLEVLTGEPAALVSTQGAPFSDYVAGESEYLDSPEARADRLHWETAVGGYSTELLDALDPGSRTEWEPGTRAPVVEPEPWVRVECDAEATAAIRARARSLGVANSALALAAYMRALASAAGNPDIAVLVPVMRRGDDYATSLGTFTESVVVRTRVGATVDEDAAAVAEAFGQARTHGRLPLSRAVAGAPQPELLMRTSFLYEPGILRYGTAYLLGEACEMPLPGYPAHPFPVPGQLGQFPFRVQIGHFDGRYIGALHYDLARFDAAQALPLATALAREFSEFAGGQGSVVIPPPGIRNSGWRHPGSDPADQVEISGITTATCDASAPTSGTGTGTETKSETRSAPAAESETEAAPTAATSVLDRIRDAVCMSPTAAAVTSGADTLAYWELWAAAGDVAASLTGADPGPVAVFLPKSPTAVAAILGVMRSGRPFVVIDPAYPGKRREDMFSEGARTVLTDQENSDLVPDGVVVVLLPEATPGTRRGMLRTDGDPDGYAGLIRPAAGSPAYTVFTSGSTGRPKRILVSHGTLLASTDARVAAYPEQPGRFLHLSSLSFDSAYAGLFWTLASGGELVLQDMSTSPSPAELAEVIRDRAVTHLLAIPTLYEAILETVDAADLGSLRQVIVAGEECRRGVVEAHHRALGDVGLANEYGPAEGTIWATVAHLHHDDDEVTIGGPIPGVEAVLLDDELREVGPGQAAHLHLSGNLAIGYPERSRDTASAFVPDPRTGGGQRLYRTGDLVSRLPDGRLRFHGRIDDQFKINGFRVEPQEIEEAFRKVTGVSAIAVSTGSRIVLLVEETLAVSSAAQARVHDDPAVLRSTAELLPGYMAPSRIIRVDRFPTGVNGKVDRRAAADLARGGLSGSAPAGTTAGVPVATAEVPTGVDTAPGPDVHRDIHSDIHSDHAEVLRSTVARILGGEVSGDAGFLDQGGDSISAMKVIGALRSEGLQVEPRALLGQGTLTEVAAGITSHRAAPSAPASGGSGTNRTRSESTTDTEVPLSRRQRAMLLQSWEPGAGAVYIEQFVLDLGGAVDIDRLAKAWRQVFRTYPILAATVRGEGDARHLDISAPGQVAVDSDPVGHGEGDWHDFLEQDRQAGFPEGAGPLSRVRIARYGRGVRCVWTHHHAVADGWSLPIVGKSLARAYAGLELPAVAAAPVEFARAVIAREQERSNSQRGSDAGTAAGRVVDALATPGPDLPAEQTRSLVVPSDIDGVARTLGVTTGVLVNAAWSLALSRVLGRGQVDHGLVTSGRDLPVAGVEEAVGLFISTAGVGGHWPPDARVADGLAVVSDAVLAALEGDGPDAGAVDSIVVIENYPFDESALDFGAGVTVRGVDLLEHTEFPLTLQVRTWPELRFDLHVDPQRVPAVAASEIGRCVEAVLAECAADAAGRRSVASAVPVTAAPGRPEDDTGAGANGLLDRISGYAAGPGGTAVLTADAVEIDYTRLDGQRREIAQGLRRAGVRPGDVVAVGVDGVAEPLSTLLALLEVGAAWVVLDGAMPASRRAAVIDRSGAGWVIDLAAEGRIHRLGDSATRSAEVEVTDDLLAYLIFTSGTTGEPKCIGVNRRALFRHLSWASRHLGYGPGEVVLVFGTLTFDASIEQALGALWSGGTAVLRPQSLLEPVEMAGFMRRHGVTLFNPPTGYYLRFVTEVGPSGWPGCVRTIVVGGEALPEWSTRERLREGVRVINAYGPTEGVITALTHDARPGEDAITHPIGLPLGSRGSYVLGEDLRAVAPGVIGQLYLSEPLADGYLGEAAHTASAFLPDPFAGRRGARMYATGDLVVADTSGEISFLSRADRQLKIRGFRVDPAEVETAVRAAGVASTRVFVIARGEGSAPELACAITLPDDDRDHAEVVADLRTVLRGTLPPHLVPGRIVAVASIPLTGNGKVDDEALRGIVARPGVGATDAGVREDDDAPGTDRAARAIAEGWSRILGPDAPVDGFLSAGGDSLKVLELSAYLRRHGLRVDASVLMSDGSRAELERTVTRDPAAAASGSQPEVSTALPPAAHWFRHRVAGDGEPETWNMAVRIETDGVLPCDQVYSAVTAVQRVHPMLRSRLDTGDSGGANAGPGSGWSIILNEADPLVLNLDSRDADWARKRLFNDLSRRVGARTGHMIGFGVHRDHSRSETSILVVAHHLVVDIVSLTVVVDDLMRAIEAVGRGEEPELPPEGTSVHEWATWLYADAELESTRRAVAAAYRGVAPHVVEPAGRERDSVTARVDLGADRVAGVTAATGLSAEEVLQLACARAAAPADSTDVVLEIETHGRDLLSEGIDLSRTVGWFTALLPMPLTVGPMDRMAAELRGRRRFLGKTGHAATTAYRARAGGPVPGLGVDVGVNFAGRLTVGGGGYRVSMVGEGRLRAAAATRPVRVAVDAWIDGDSFVASVQHVDPAALVEFCRALDDAVDELSRMEPIGDSPGWCAHDLAGNDPAAVEEAADGAVATLAPLTSQQAGMFLRTETDPHGAYIEQTVLELPTGIDPDEVARRLGRLGVRYPLLRARVVWDILAEPVLVVPRRNTIRTDRLDTGAGFGTDELGAVAAAEISAMAASGGRWLFRALVLNGDRPRLVLTYHHLVVDGWTIRILLDEVSNPTAEGGKPDWRMLDHMVADVVHATAVEGVRLPPASMDAVHQPRLNRAFEEGTGAVVTDHGAEVNADLELTLSAEETAALGDWARQVGVTMSSAVHFVWALALAGHSEDGCTVRFGSVRQVRDERTGDAPGMFLETVSLEVRLAGDAAAADLAREMHAALHGTRRPDDSTEIARSAAAITSGPFDTAVIVDDDRGANSVPSFLGHPVRLVAARERTGLPLTLSAVDSSRSGGLTFTVNCDTTRFSHPQGMEVLERVAGLCRRLATGPGELAALTEGLPAGGLGSPVR